jgi:predicted Zn-ribbon and HTH transcriptional regulator
MGATIRWFFQVASEGWHARLSPAGRQAMLAGDVDTMLRRELIDLLLNRPMSVTQIARLLDARPAEVADDLAHLFRSLKHVEFTAVVEPATCRKCGFRFSSAKLTKPSKCPECRGTWVTEPLISIVRKEAS